MRTVGEGGYINGIDAVSSTDVWAVGEATPNDTDWRGIALRWNGARWSEQRIPFRPNVNRYFQAVDAIAPGDAWIVGRMETGPDATLTMRLTAC